MKKRRAGARASPRSSRGSTSCVLDKWRVDELYDSDRHRRWSTRSPTPPRWSTSGSSTASSRGSPRSSSRRSARCSARSRPASCTSTRRRWSSASRPRLVLRAQPHARRRPSTRAVGRRATSSRPRPGSATSTAGTSRRAEQARRRSVRRVDARVDVDARRPARPKIVELEVKNAFDRTADAAPSRSTRPGRRRRSAGAPTAPSGSRTVPEAGGAADERRSLVSLVRRSGRVGVVAGVVGRARSRGADSTRRARRARRHRRARRRSSCMAHLARRDAAAEATARRRPSGRTCSTCSSASRSLGAVAVLFLPRQIAAAARGFTLGVMVVDASRPRCCLLRVPMTTAATSSTSTTGSRAFGIHYHVAHRRHQPLARPPHDLHHADRGLRLVRLDQDADQGLVLRASCSSRRR